MGKDAPPGSVLRAAVDVEAREDVQTLTERLHALETLAHDIEHALWGDSRLRNNGLRSRSRIHSRVLQRLIKRFDDLDAELRHYLDKGREETCFGTGALEAHVEQHHNVPAKEETEVAVAKIQAGATRSSSSWQSIAMIVGQALTLIGVLLVAFK